MTERFWLVVHPPVVELGDLEIAGSLVRARRIAASIVSGGPHLRVSVVDRWGQAVESLATDVNGNPYIEGAGAA